MTTLHKAILILSCLVIATELSAAVFYFQTVTDWVSHNLWVVIIPFLKGVFKRMAAVKFMVLFKSVFVLLSHLFKLLLLKILKTLGIRYGVFFSQNRWYWIRRAKVMFVRRGKQFFRALARFWSEYKNTSKWIIFIAFFPLVLLLAFLGLSFNVTRKTMVQKTQETAIFKMATKASTKNHGVKSWISKLDQWTLEKIRKLTPRGLAGKKPGG